MYAKWSGKEWRGAELKGVAQRRAELEKKRVGKRVDVRLGVHEKRVEQRMEYGK